MSSSDSEERQSYSKRICDDLSEVILQFLPIEDKLRHECVSKQFQRTVFQRQQYIPFDDILAGNGNELLKALNAFEALLKKCPNIRRIYNTMNCYVLFTTDLIIKYCNHLKELNHYLFTNEKNRHNLVKVINWYDFTLNFKSRANSNTPPLHSIRRTFNSLSLVRELYIKGFNFKFNLLPHLMALKNLKRIPFHSKYSNIEELQTLIQNNKSIKMIDILATDYHSNQLIVLFNELSKLKDLIQMKISSETALNAKSLTNSLKQMALKCVKMRSISCDLRLDPNHTMSSLKSFKGLKRLTVRVMFENGITPEFCMSIFEGFEKLTHLTLEIKLALSETVLKHIEVFLPKLRYLKIQPKLVSSESVADILSRLSCLEVIDISVDDEAFKQQIETKLRINCVNIRSIKISIVKHRWMLYNH